MTPDREPVMDNIMNGMTHKDGGGSGDVISGSLAEHSPGRQTSFVLQTSLI